MSNLNFQVHLASWIIQDGNYDDFTCNQRREFALEFWIKEELKFDGLNTPISYECLGDSSLTVNADVIVCTNSWYAIDFGIRAFQEQSPTNELALGKRVSGSVYLGVDPFFYKEYLHRNEEAYPMIYLWDINRIQMETAPFIEKHQPGIGKALIRDPDR